ncbi:major facilitator superfamily protein [Halalkalicoccus jeotgali B3]|uniref:Major facilitator superfamily MFS_1 n=2 Tax=Halalkalicoccus jeotgali TaxID=413810 RepID=D8J8B2_HALJB|nr:MFS transporter [Halalkalicoccus jeotgali]ADJ16158.1 major facilitator superfamily MFS_1 [Halalkalicoccus jeotgali B3]ELY37587.1 major facilitator superfamily protein [Halalkalicoccus jeotgali B3]
MALFETDRRILALAMARMADGVGNSFLIIVLPLYIASGIVEGRTFGLTESMLIGIVLSLVGFVSSLSQPFTGRVSDRTGRRKFYILVGLGGLTTANLLYLFAGSYLSLIALRALQGVSIAFIIPASVALVNELAGAGTRGGNMGVYNTFRLVGFGAGPIAAGVLVNAGPYSLFGVALSGFDATFYVAAGAAALGLLLVSALVHDPAELERAGEDLSIDVFDGDGGLDPVFTLGIASLFMAIGIALFATLQPEINARLDQGSTWFGVQFAAFIISQVFLQVPIGRASDRWGRKPFILAGLVLLVPSTLAQGLVLDSWLMLVVRLTQGVAGAMVFAPALALAGDLATGGDSGTKLSVLTMAFGLGIALGPLSAGFLVSLGFVVPFAVGATLAVVGFVLVYTQVEETVGAERHGAGSEPVPQD